MMMKLPGKQHSLGWFVALVTVLLQTAAITAQRPVDADWKGNAVLDQVVVVSDPSLGTARG